MLKFFKNEQSKINEADQHLNDKKFDEIKVIGAGLPRTGTLSLKTALTQLYGGEINLVKTGFHKYSKLIQIQCFYGKVDHSKHIFMKSQREKKVFWEIPQLIG